MALALLAPVLFLVNVRWMRPEYNWDLLAYVAVAERFGGATPAEAHERTYALARARLDPATYELLTDANAYRRAVASDTVAFVQQLPFYSVKPAYPWLIEVLGGFGVNPIDASVAISQAAYLGVGLILLAWLLSSLPVAFSFLSAWGVMSLPFAVDLGRLSTPDALSTAMVLAGLFLVFQLGRSIAGCVVLLSSMLARPDNLLWLVPVAAYVALRARSRRSVVLLAIIVPGVVLWRALSLAAGNAGWRTLFYHSFVERLAYPLVPPPALRVAEYLHIYLRETHPLSVPPFVVLFALLSVWLLVSWKRDAGSERHPFLLYAVITFGVLHWLVYPGEDRFLAPAYLAVLVLLAQRLMVRRAEGQDAARPLGEPPTRVPDSSGAAPPRGSRPPPV